LARRRVEGDGVADILTENAAPPPLRHILAVVSGNALEFYDFLTYAFFAVYIGATFFPGGDPTAQTLASLATFGAGFLTRPIGAMVIGPMGDRVGRKPAMILTFALMGFAIIGLALTPSYARIGIAAPIIAIAFRLLQGFALGGDVGPTTAYLIEAAPVAHRGFYTSLQAASQRVSTLVSSLIGTFLALTLSAQQLTDWGWRAAMLIGALIVPFGLAIRRNLPETLHAADDAALAPDATKGTLTLRAEWRAQLSNILFGFALLASATIGVYVQQYMTTYGLTTLHMNAVASFGVSSVTSIVAIGAALLGGSISDRVGRKPVMLWPGFVALFSIVPVFWLITHVGGVATFYGGLAWVTFWSGVSTGLAIVVTTELLPARIRSGAMATTYAFSISIFGGSTQFIVAWLIARFHVPMMPAYYWTAAMAAGLIAMALVPESAPLLKRGNRR
jgi:MHS family citrate/tricarballylate:H+ symporter-like MFS transporter